MKSFWTERDTKRQNVKLLIFKIEKHLVFHNNCSQELKLKFYSQAVLTPLTHKRPEALDR